MGGASKPKLAIVPGSFCVHRFEAYASIPAELLSVEPCWIGRTADELSIVCSESVPVDAARTDRGWACLRVKGTLEFTLTGILAGISAVLAEAEISLFALSTFDTDYVLVKKDRLESAIEALREAGYDIE